MKFVLALGFVLSYSVNAAINTNINMKLGKLDKAKIITTALTDGEVKVIKFPEQNQIVEIRATEDIPEAVRNDDIILGQIYYDIKIYKTEGEKKTLISSPQVTTVIGEEAKVEMTDSSGKESFILKILASSIN